MMARHRLYLGLISCFFFLNLLVWTAVFEVSRPSLLEVVFFEVGQGDAIFIETGWGHQILIDGGPSRAVLEKLSREMPFYDRTIDLVILTHPDKDHVFGLIEVLKNYQVENILITDSEKETLGFEQWQQALKKEREAGAHIRIASAGQKISANNLVFEVLNPYNLKEQEAGDINDASIVLRLVFGQNTFLFTGDLTEAGEKGLIQRGADLDSEILKLGHHGSRFSTSEAFLEAVLPELAVISVGEKNPYQHPHQETLARLEKRGIKVIRTDQQGDIKIISNGYNFNLR